MNVEMAVVQKLSLLVPYRVSADVPRDKPSAFVTVERTGTRRRIRGLVTQEITVKCWNSAGRKAAAEMSDEVDEAMTLIDDGKPITHVEPDTGYNDPSVEGIPRYQLVYTVTAHIDY